MNHRLLMTKTEDYKKSIEYLMENNFIDTGKICDECAGFSMELTKNKVILRWVCRNCYKKNLF
ncbi:hypothetical protein H311_04406 [Anncaliia algerae PRA109]|nr:hypothetical protein H311_04406 [Anncaliia algerae PRA109]